MAGWCSTASCDRHPRRVPVLYLTSFFAPVQQLVQLYTTYQSGQAAVTKLRDLLGTQPSVPESPTAHGAPPPIEGRVELDAVSFGYRPDVPVLREVDLVEEAGRDLPRSSAPRARASGPIAKLVTQYHDPTAGAVRIDGHNLHEVTLASLRRAARRRAPGPLLFAASLRENVAFGLPGATDVDVRAACDTVGLGDLLDRLPDGLDTFVHEHGVSLSSGERQLITLAGVPGTPTACWCSTRPPRA